MSEKEKKILEIFGNIIPFLSELEKEWLLGFCEGITHRINESNKREVS